MPAEVWDIDDRLAYARDEIAALEAGTHPALADLVETEESGQTRLGVEGEQRALDMLAAPTAPAPVWSDSGQTTDHRTEAQKERESRGVVLFNGEEISREAYDRLRRGV